MSDSSLLLLVSRQKTALLLFAFKHSPDSGYISIYAAYLYSLSIVIRNGGMEESLGGSRLTVVVLSTGERQQD